MLLPIRRSVAGANEGIFVRGLNGVLRGATRGTARAVASIPAVARAVLQRLPGVAEGVGFEPTRLFTPSHFRDDRTRPTMRPLRAERPFGVTVITRASRVQKYTTPL